MTTRTCTVAPCGNAVQARGLCNTHYSRWRLHGTTDAPPPRPTRPPWLRVMDKTAPGENGCIEYQGRRHHFGHGVLGIGSRTDGTRQDTTAHRVIWTHHHGAIPEDLIVRHKCDNPPCVNIDHLELGTRADNTADREKRGRSARGNRYPQAKLTPEKVREIRRRRTEGEQTKALAADYGVSDSTIRGVIHGLYWSWV